MSIDTHTTDHRPDPAEQVCGIPLAVDAPFVARHLGPRDEDVAAMLSVIGKDSLDDLIATTLPSAITPSIFTPTTCCITLAVPRPCSRCWTRSS